MSDAGALGGFAPANQVGTRDAQGRIATAQGSATTSAAQPAAADAKPVAAEPAVAIAASLAGLRVGQELRGTVVRAPGSAKPLLRTPLGDFTVEPASALPESGDVTLVPTRTDRLAAALLLTANGEVLDVPAALRLNLVALAGTPPQGQEDAAPPPAPSPPPQPAPPGMPQALPAMPGNLSNADGSAIVLLTEALRFQAAGALSGLPSADPKAKESAAPRTQAAAPAAAPAATPVTGADSQAAPSSSGSTRGLSAMLSSAMATPSAETAAITHLLELGTAELWPEAGNRADKPLSVSLLAVADGNDDSPLTRPPADSPLARLTASGRLVTATVIGIPESANGDAPAQKPEASPAYRAADGPATHAMRLAINGRIFQWPLALHAPQPSAGTQLVLLVAKTVDGVAPTEAQAHAAIAADAEKSGARTAVSAHGAAAPSSHDAVASAPSPRSSLIDPATGVPLPILPGAVLAAAAPLATESLAAKPGDALIQAVLRAFGRTGLKVTLAPDMQTDEPADSDSASTRAPIAERLARVSAANLLESYPSTARAEPQPEALPVALNLQTPQGNVPLVMLVWPRPEEQQKNGQGGENDGAEGAGIEVCFVLEVDFGDMGPLRLRGDVSPRNLHLAVETDEALPADLQQSTRAVFTEAVEAGGMTGALVFRRRQDSTPAG